MLNGIVNFIQNYNYSPINYSAKINKRSGIIPVTKIINRMLIFTIESNGYFIIQEKTYICTQINKSRNQKFLKSILYYILFILYKHLIQQNEH